MYVLLSSTVKLGQLALKWAGGFQMANSFAQKFDMDFTLAV